MSEIYDLAVKMAPFITMTAKTQSFTPAQVSEWFTNGWVIDGRKGGIVLGRSHSEGHVYLLRQESTDAYHICGTVQGGEYLVNTQAAAIHSPELKRLNAIPRDDSLGVDDRPLSDFTRVLCTSAQPFDYLILVDDRSQTIMNGSVTATHLERIQEINESTNPFTQFPLHEFFDF